MPWYYAGPEAKPLGPVSAEQLQALCAGGTITPDTFVIEHTGPGAANLAWKRYREIFPTLPALPPIPGVGHPTIIPPTPPVPALHPTIPGSPYGGMPAGYPVARPTNIWCAWGFALSILGFCFAWLCGLGAIPALIGVVLCIIGLVQTNKNREQSGIGLAITGLIFAGVALIIAVLILVWMGGPILRAHGYTVTEQTSNDSE